MGKRIGKWILCLLFIAQAVCLFSAAQAARIDDAQQDGSSTQAVSSTETLKNSRSSDMFRRNKFSAKRRTDRLTRTQAASSPSPSATERDVERDHPDEDPLPAESDKEATADVVETTDNETPAPARREQGSSTEKTHSEMKVRKTGDKYVTLDFDNVNIEVFVKFVSELTGKNFIIDDKVRGKVTIYSPRKILLSDVYKVFLSVLEINGYATVPVGDMIKIVPTTAAREKSLETRVKKDIAEAEDRMITQIITLEQANADEVKRVLDPIIPRTSSILSYSPAGILIITDYQSNIRRMQEIVKALDVEGAGEQITYLPLQNASASEVAKSLGLVFQQRRANRTAVRVVADTRTNSLIIYASVADTENVRKLVTMMDKEVPRGESNIQVYRLQNSVAEDLAKVLTSIIKEVSATSSAPPTASAAATSKTVTPVISKNVQIVPDKATNSLVIMAEREDYKVLEGIIKQLDVPRAMVYIEALVMEVNTTKDFQLGVEWSAVKDTGQVGDISGSGSAAFVSSGTGVLSSLKTTSTTAGTLLGFPSGFAMGILGAGITIGDVIFPTIGAMIQAYKGDTDVSILSTPQLMTLDNEEAEINVGSNVPYITRQESTSTSTLVNYNTYEYKDVGVTLNITPNINQENYVRLKISQEVTKVTSDASSTTPTTLKRTAKTTVVVKDNETVVIGGLVGDSTDNANTSVPWLSDVPVLGWLFKARSVTREKTNLYVFLTPHIVRSPKDAAVLYKGKRDSMGDVVEGVIKLDEKKQAIDTHKTEPAKKDKSQAAP